MLNSKLHTASLIALLAGLCSTGATSLAFAEQPALNDPIQDTYKEGTQVKIDEDQDEVYDAVQKGLIKPFSELYAAIDNQLNGRLIKVELEEDDSEWIYDLKLVHEDKVIRVEYNATTLELMSIKGRDVLSIIKNRDAQ
ncbi:PepSY domain-containing protein [Vibrio diazotrophicus]|uniref:PepSY domain-containing protein n=1 Tax=Vibrio diazotrophicus TaxID=685 RepID=UPI0020CA2DC2|nr:hypothetical protein [Vibrio diazotrophicus]